MRRLAALTLASLAALAGCQDAPVTAPSGTSAAPRLLVAAPSARAIPGRYIVVLAGQPTQGITASAAAAAATTLAARYGGQVDHVYRAALNGFSARMSAADAARLAADPAVAWVEPDQIATISATQSPVPSWGLDRVDQASLPLSGSYTYAYTGAGVRVYIIDTGIRTTHTDFGGRASSGYDAVDGSLPAADCNGHGTHVAGTAGGTAYGIAKGASLVAVRVLDCAGSGSYSGVIAGVDWVRINHVKPAVANMSLGGGFSSALNSAVTNAISAGVTFAVAAGNSAANACSFSPSSTTAALTVGATTSTDARASYSNYGSCLDLFAPGSSITSAWYSGDNASSTLNGTSMASPHVAGAAALYLESNPGASPATVASALTTNATANKVTGAGTGSPNRLLYTGFLGGGSPPPPPPPGGNQPPVARFTWSCNATHVCQFNSSTSTDDGGIVKRRWNWGDGSPEQAGLSPKHQYARAGTYTVTLKVWDGAGLMGSLSQSVPVP
jgi:subtilisin family serine protease